MFKICLEYWNFFVPDVYSSVCTIEPSGAPAAQVGLGYRGWARGWGCVGGAAARAGARLGGLTATDDRTDVPQCFNTRHIHTLQPRSLLLPPQFSFGGAAPAAPAGGVARKALYHKTLSQLRALMIARMAKPEEVGVLWLLQCATVLGVSSRLRSCQRWLLEHSHGATSCSTPAPAVLLHQPLLLMCLPPHLPVARSSWWRMRTGTWCEKR